MSTASRREQDFLNAVLENAGALVVVLDHEGRIHRFNRACEKLSGYTFAEVDGKYPWETFLPPEDADTIRVQAFEKLAHNPQAAAGHYTNYWLGKDGARHLIEWSNTLLLDTGGKMEFMVCVGTDITERHRTEQQLLLKNAAVENALNAIAMSDLDGQLNYVNPAFLRMWGYGSAAEVLGRLATEFWVLPVQAESVIAALQQHGQWAGALEARRADGQTFVVELMAALIRDAAGHPVQMLGSFVDVTARKRSEQSLRQSEAWLRHTQAIANVGSWELDLATDLLKWSDETCQIFGRDPIHYGNNYAMFLDAVHPADRGAVDQAYKAAVNNRTPYDIAHRIVRPDGAVRWVQERGETLYDGQGKALRTLGAVQDITEHVHGEAALRTSTQVVNAVLDTTPVLIAYLDTNMNFVRVNAAYAAADQKEPPYFVGKNHFALFPNAENETIFRRVVETGVAHVARAKPFEYEYSPERGVTHWDWTLTPIKDGEDHVTGLVLSLTNVTDRIQALEAVQRSAQELKALNESLETRVLERTAEVQQQAQRSETILRTTPDGFFATNIAGRLRAANPAFCALLGYTEAELQQMAITDIEANENPADVAAHIERVIARGYDRFDTRHRRKDGSAVAVEISVSLVDVGGEKLFYAFARDITARKESEAALIRARDEAERANKAKSEFLSRMSHELRTPMNAILGFAQVLEMEKTVTPEQKEFVYEIHRAADHLLELINELLDLARIEAGKLTVLVKPVALAPVVAQAIEMAQPHLTARQSVLINHCDRNAKVLADSTRLRQILMNLLSNAAKYNRQGGRITLDCAPLDGQRLRLSVADTGQGIPPEKLQHLFRPFERLGAEHGPVEGAGIGLALSKQLAELMGASLGVESRHGQGTLFWIDMPIAESVPGTAPASPPPETVRADGDGVATVLYVEDNPANLRLVEALFRRQPRMKLLSATDGEQGLELARRYKPDAILLDIQLPGMDGYAVLKALRADDATRAIPVIALSADAMTADLERGKQAGFVHYLTKPVKMELMLSVLREITARQ